MKNKSIILGNALPISLVGINFIYHAPAYLKKQITTEALTSKDSVLSNFKKQAYLVYVAVLPVVHSLEKCSKLMTSQDTIISNTNTPYKIV